MDDGYIRESGKLLLTADAPIVEAGGIRIGRFAVHIDTLKHLVSAGMSVRVAQLYGLVVPGMVLTRHIFQGLNRPLYCDGSMNGDSQKLIYARRPAVDWVTYKDQTGQLHTMKCGRPDKMTFLVIVSPNDRHRDLFPSVDGWIDHWNWVEEDPVLAEAPINWVDRYDRRLHTFEVSPPK